MHRKVTVEVDEEYATLLLDRVPINKSDYEEWLQRVEGSDTVGQIAWNIMYPFFNPMFDCMAEKLIYELDEKTNEEDRCRMADLKERFIDALKDKIQHME